MTRPRRDKEAEQLLLFLQEKLRQKLGRHVPLSQVIALARKHFKDEEKGK